MKYLLAIDVGTTNVKVSVYTPQLKEVERTKKSLKIGVSGAAAEQSPEEIYKAMVEAVRSVALKPEVRSKIASIFVSSQMHGLALLGSDGKPLTPLYTYLDRRAAAHAERLEEMLGRKIYEETGCPPLYIYPLAKLLWLKQGENFRGAEKVSVSAKDYVLWRLTGRHVIDPSTASGSQLLNIHSLKWSGLALDAADISEDMLPAVVREDEPLKLKRDEAEKLGLSNDVQVYPGVSDAAAHQAGVLALTGEALALNIGTSAAVRIASRRPIIDSSDMRFFCYYGFQGRWLVGGAVNNAGVALEWLIKRVLSMGTDADAYKVLEEELLQTKPVPGGLIFIPFLSGERFPVRDSEARGIIYGLTLAHGRAEIVRALTEGVAYTLRWIYDSMRENGLSAEEIRLGGGGARMRTWRKIIASVFGMRVIYPKVGAELLGDAVLWSSIQMGVKLEDVVETIWEEIKVETEQPVEESVKTYAEAYRKFKRLYIASKEAFS